MLYFGTPNVYENYESYGCLDYERNKHIIISNEGNFIYVHNDSPFFVGIGCGWDFPYDLELINNNGKEFFKYIPLQKAELYTLS